MSASRLAASAVALVAAMLRPLPSVMTDLDRAESLKPAKR
jgi:hypothetical protein